jgi:hypothetical protein
MSKTIEALVPLAQYQQSRAHLFPSIESLRWFARKHRPELNQAAAILQIAGRVNVNPAAFDAVVLEAGKRAAQQTRGNAL